MEDLRKNSRSALERGLSGKSLTKNRFKLDMYSNFIFRKSISVKRWIYLTRTGFLENIIRYKLDTKGKKMRMVIATVTAQVKTSSFTYIKLPI